MRFSVIEGILKGSLDELFTLGKLKWHTRLHLTECMVLRNSLLVQKGAKDHFTAWQYFIGLETAAQDFDQETICSRSIILKSQGSDEHKI